MSKKKTGTRKFRRKVLSVSQIVARIRKQTKRKGEQKKRKKPIKPIIPPKSLIIILKRLNCAVHPSTEPPWVGEQHAT